MEKPGAGLCGKFENVKYLTSPRNQLYGLLVRKLLYSSGDSFALIFKWRHIDLLGALSAFLCLVHCVSLPLLAFILPLGTVSAIGGHDQFGWAFIAYSFLVGSYSTIHGYFHHHASLVVVLTFLFGFTLLLVNIFFLHTFYILTISGSLCLFFAHILNWQLSRRKNLSCPCSAGNTYSSTNIKQL